MDFPVDSLSILRELQLIKAFYEEQVSDLFNDFQRIGNPAGPEGIPDLIDLTTNFVRQHDVCSLDLCTFS